MQLMVLPFSQSPRQRFKIMNDIHIFSHTESIAKSCYPFCPPFGPYVSLSKMEKIILTNLCCKVLHFNCSVLTWFNHISPTTSSLFPDMSNSFHVLWYIYYIAIVESGCNTNFSVNFDIHRGQIMLPIPLTTTINV